MFPKRKNKFFQDLDYLTACDINDNKPTIDKLARINPYLEKDKTLMYNIIVNTREDLDEQTKIMLKTIANKSLEEEKKKLQRYLDVMEDVREKYKNENKLEE